MLEICYAHARGGISTSYFAKSGTGGPFSFLNLNQSIMKTLKSEQIASNVYGQEETS